MQQPCNTGIFQGSLYTGTRPKIKKRKNTSIAFFLNFYSYPQNEIYAEISTFTVLHKKLQSKR